MSERVNVCVAAAGCKLIPPTLAGPLCRGGAKRREPKQEGKAAGCEC